MTLFCLVHGSTQKASCWDLVVPELENRGYDVVRPQLPTNEPDASATLYGDVIAATIPEDRGDVIVVAHSASGLFLPLVSERRMVRRMVFLMAVIPQVGKSLTDQFAAERDMLNPAWVGKDPTQDRALADEFLFHDCSPERKQWGWRRMSLLLARRAMLEVCPLQAWPDVPASYIVCSDDRTIQPEWARRAARERLGVEAIELPGGHCPYISRPKELADLLASLT